MSTEKIDLKSPILEGLQEQDLDLLRGCAAMASFEAGKYLFREGEEANKFYLIKQGKAAVQIHSPNKGPITIQTVEEGDFLGWSWLFPPYKWHFDGRAVTLVRAVELDARCMRAICDQNPRFGYALVQRFSGIMHQRLMAARMQILDFYGGDRA